MSGTSSLISLFRIATPFIKEQTAASAWLLCHDVALPVFNKITRASNLLGERLEGTASERIMAIIGHFTTVKGITYSLRYKNP